MTDDGASQIAEAIRTLAWMLFVALLYHGCMMRVGP
jgi:hypothetical protein